MGKKNRTGKTTVGNKNSLPGAGNGGKRRNSGAASGTDRRNSGLASGTDRQDSGPASDANRPDQTGFDASALPPLFLKRMEGFLGSDFADFADSYRTHEQVRGLRLNTLKLDRERALALCGAEFGLAPVPWCRDGFYYAPETRPGRHPLHEAGLYYIQEPSAMIVAALSGTRPGERVLDLCAAPGGKTTALAAMLEGRGLLVANEIHPERARILSQNVERMGVRNAVVTNEPPERLAGSFGSFFDRVVVDAPCSGEGMFAKEPEALVHWSTENVALCAARQRDILESADRMLRDGGVLVYSTCTFAPEEDEGAIGAFLAKHPEYHVWNPDERWDHDEHWNLEGQREPEDAEDTIDHDDRGLRGNKERPWGFDYGRPEWTEESAPYPEIAGAVRLWPHRIRGEGHFVCVLRKGGGETRPGDSAGTAGSDGMETGSSAGAAGSGSRTAGSAGRTGRQQAKAAENYAIWKEAAPDFLRDADAGLLRFREGIVRYGDELYLLPEGITEADLAGIRVLRAGLDLGSIVESKRGERRFEPAHALAMALKPEEAAAVVSFGADSREIRAFLRGEAIRPESGMPAGNGWVLVTVDGVPAGWCKAAGGVLKNHYPKGLRREV